MGKFIAGLSFAVFAVVTTPAVVHACDYGIAEADLVIAEPMTEQEIMTLIAAAKERVETQVEQASK